MVRNRQMRQLETEKGENRKGEKQGANETVGNREKQKMGNIGRGKQGKNEKQTGGKQR